MIRLDAAAGVVHCTLDDLLDPGWAASSPAAGDAFESVLEWRGLELHVQVAVDALRRERGGVVPELRHALDGSRSGRENAIERAGLAALLLRRCGERVPRARVIEVDARGGEVGRIDVACAGEIWAERLERRLAARLAPDRVAVERACARAAFADQLAFPFEALRPGQEVLLRDIEGAARSGLWLLCAAPTGLGKTAAALHPLLRHALREGRTLWFTTARVSQQALALQTLQRMLPPGAPAHAVQIAARQRICTPGAGCTAVAPELGSACALRRDGAARMERSGILEELAALGVVDAEALAARARAARLCPFEVSLALARSASAIVGDFNYVFDPRSRLALVDAGEREPLLVVDEAHNLIERARGYFSPALSLADLERLAGALAPARARAYREIRELLAEAASHLRQRIARLAEERADPAPWVDPPERGFWEPIEGRAASLQLDYLLQRDGEGRAAALRTGIDRDSPGDPVLGALRGLADFARCSGLDPERSACVWRPDGVRLLCLDPAPWLASIWRRFRAVVCMSATLAPFAFHRRMLGLESPRTEALDLPSPFPPRNRLLLAVSSVDTTYRRRDDDAPRIAELIARCVALRRGNYLAFFPSFAYRDAVVARLPAPRPRVLLQVPGLPAEATLSRLARNRRETLLVCGVQGGVLAEGVDYPGELAVGVFVVGPGLPAVTLEQELIRAYYERELGQGFDYAYLFPGLARAVQAGGRALRSATDRAAIVLLCRRFCEPMYREHLPPWWREELIEARDPVPALRAFWKRAEHGRD